MVSAKLKGGLGNQMFQIAAAHALALRNGDISGFIFDTCFTPLQGKTSTHYSDNIFSLVNKINNYTFKNFYNEFKHSYSEIEYKKDILIDGYFQSEKYFLDYKEEIINLFKIPEHYENKIKDVIDFSKMTTSVHVRRGDYLLNPHIHPTCDIEYFKKSMNMLSDSNFIFISDDIEWVKKNFKGDNIIYSEFNDDITDLKVMTMCDNNIISNSTFSWWGAYLNKKNNKTVIGPKLWFGASGPSDQFDILPNNWIKI